MPKGFSEHEKKIIAQRLLEEGYKQFAAHGLKKTCVEELARAAGISKGAFYIFYESKETLFMDVVEEVEKRVRHEVLAVIDLPGPSARERLVALLKKAFELFRTIPILQYFTGSEYDLIIRRVPAEKLQEHLANDHNFLEELVNRCREAGIPIRVQAGQITTLLYPLVLAVLHEDDLGSGTLRGSIDILLELVAAYCLGEVAITGVTQGAPPVSLILEAQK